MADLQDLFARLKSPNASAPASDSSTPLQMQGQSQHQQQQQPQQQHQQHPSIWAQPQHMPPHMGGYQQPSVSSPIFSPPSHTPNPHYGIMSPAVPPPHGQSPMADPKANNLLNLLKFSSNQQTSQSQQQSPLASLHNIAGPHRSPALSQQQTPQQPQYAPSNHSRNISASDLVASFQPKQPSASSMRNFLASPQPEVRPDGFNSPHADTQNFLLGLLSKPKQSTADADPVESPVPQPPAAVVDDLVKGLRDATIEANAADAAQSQAAREATPLRLFGAESREETPFEAPSSAKKGPVFTYVNPFEQLSASSPKPTSTPTPTPTPTPIPKPHVRTGTPRVEILKHGRDISGSADGEAAGPLHKTRKLGSTAPSPAPASPAPRPASRTAPLDASHQSVSEVLSGIGEKVDKQVEKALAAAGGKASVVNADKSSASAANGDKPKAADNVADSWESADADESPANDSAARLVPVYNFPMKPFVAIDINKAEKVTPVRPDSLMDVARLKKDFEQIDRSLVTASTNHIVYSMSKDGGFRIIRQDSGKDKKVFRSGERIFNLHISSANGNYKDTEAILGTGINGSVFWTNIVKVEGDAWDEYNLESQGFILPPVPVQDDNTSGSPVKTRAKMSSRHADFFAISRGKSIYIISPYVARHNTYADKKTRVVNNQKYLEEHCLKIHTGKAGKDFAFSEDDSLLVSLDKSGRIKFWDIREIAEAAQDTNLGARKPIELKAPLLTLTAALPLEKATPSSIMFVDKERPCVKGVALRYLIVGLKQNHILQLWDLGLNKPVQEIHFPHDKDSDAICSIAYHPKTGIIALGHPTRNSIYFIHLSAPRYNINSMDQARYITMLASEDPALARPESTAIMSGIRELSFASKGQLRSVDMLKSPVPSENSESALFELYAMHSKGVTTITIKHEDLGWSLDNKVLNPVDGQEAGYITVNDLRAAAAPAPNEASNEAAAKPSSKPASTASPPKAEASKPAAVARSVSKQEPAAVNGAAKAEKPRKTVPEQVKPAEPATNPAILTPASYAMAAQKTRSPSPAKAAASVAADKTPLSTLTTNGTASLDVESINKGINETIGRELDALYRKLDDDRRVQDAAAAAKQDAVLRLVSATLTDNVEKSLSQIVTSSINNNVLPVVSELITSTLDRKLKTTLSTTLSESVSKEVNAAMPSAIALALQDKGLQRSISELAATKVAAQAEQAFSSVLRSSIVPNFTKLAASSTDKLLAEVERRHAEQLRQAQVQRQNDNVQIAELTNLVMSLSSTIDGMAASQAAFQEQILKLQRQVASGSQEGSTASVVSVVPAAAPEIVHRSIEDEEVTVVEEMMHAGSYEEATIKWLQSPRQGELFDKLFVRVNPQYLQRLSPLVSLSVSAALTSSFDKNIYERLEWLGNVLSTIDLQEPEIREVAPKIMDVLQQRMQGAYMQIAETNPQDPALRKVSGLSRQIAEIKSLTE